MRSRQDLFISLKKKLISNSRITGVQFVKFVTIGFSNTGIHYGIFFILFRSFGLYYLLASGIGYCGGLGNSYIWNKIWTFKTKGVRKDIEFLKFFIINVISLLANIGGLKFFVSVIHMIPEYGQILAIGLSTVVNFFGNKFWTFQSGK